MYKHHRTQPLCGCELCGDKYALVTREHDCIDLCEVCQVQHEKNVLIRVHDPAVNDMIKELEGYVEAMYNSGMMREV